jgi:hypothetical protein
MIGDGDRVRRMTRRRSILTLMVAAVTVTVSEELHVGAGMALVSPLSPWWTTLR